MSSLQTVTNTDVGVFLAATTVVATNQGRHGASSSTTLDVVGGSLIVWGESDYLVRGAQEGNWDSVSPETRSDVDLPDGR